MTLDINQRLNRLEQQVFPKGIQSVDDGSGVISIVPPIRSIAEGEVRTYDVLGLNDQPDANGKIERFYIFNGNPEFVKADYVGDPDTTRQFTLTGVNGGPAGTRGSCTIARNGQPGEWFIVEVTPKPQVVIPDAPPEPPVMPPSTDGPVG